jgi:hypothetical protein
MGLFDPQGIPSSPTSQQTTTGGISSWAQPYVKDLLSQAQGLSATPTGLQQQSYAGAGNLNVAPQIGQATGIAGGAAQGALGTAGTALGYGQQAAGAGQQYASMATDPSSIQAYMSPYIQQALAPQLQMLNQQQAIAGQGINAQAAGQGAFGGNRATLAQGLNAQNYDLARQQAIGQGYQNAFTQAQQAQQFGSTLGLQGLQTGLQGVQGAQNAYGLGLQGAQTLGQLGQNQYNQQANTVQLQNQLGTQQYLMPQQLLQAKAGILQGLPVGTQTTTGYQAAPNKISQIGGLGTAAIGGLGLLNQAGALNGIKNLFPGSSDSTQSQTDIANLPSDQTAINNYNNSGGWTNQSGDVSSSMGMNTTDESIPVSYGAAGGLPKHFKTKRYASGGLVSLALEQALKG